MTILSNGERHLPLPPLDSCEIAYVVAMARRHHLSFYVADNGCVVRPIRNATLGQARLHAALIARRDEVEGYVRATAPRAFDPDAEADAASWRVCRMPHEALVALTINSLNTWLAAADRGTLRYESLPAPSMPGLPPAPKRKHPSRTGAIQSDRVRY